MRKRRTTSKPSRSKRNGGGAQQRRAALDRPHIGAALLRRISRALLLAGASAIALTLASEVRAGDILRGGGGVTSPVAAVTAAQAAAMQQAQAAALQAQNSLARAAAAIQSMQTAQAAARAAAQAAASAVPDGLATGGLMPDSGVPANGDLPPSWQNVSALTQSTSGGTTTVTIKQTATEAILNWQTFNVGKNTTLDFDQQGNSSWIALNRVLDPSANPSLILGSIKADGQVYIINQNGIIFGGASQINVGTLVASALPINDALVSAGTLYSNADLQFTFTAYSQAGGTKGPTDAFTPTAATATTQDSAVIVEAGATITTPTSSTNTGGRVVLIGPEVTNAGSISTPDGQVILAAGQEVALLPHSSTDSSLRGLDVYIGSVLAPAIGSNSTAGALVTGTATNSGVIEADRGDITIAGASVVNSGALISTTSVSLNGRVDLQATYNYVANLSLGTSGAFVASASGAVTLDSGSVIQILPETWSSDTVVGSSLALGTQINITGLTDYIDGTIVAPSGTVTVDAGTWVGNANTFVYSTGQIYVDADAVIDVSGSMDVQASVTENIVAAQLESAQLADSSLLRSSFLHGATIYVDVNQTGTNADGTTWVGTPLADVSGYVALIQHTVGELTTSGGSITLNAGNSVVLQQGSLLNVSGGYIQYTGAVVNTTRLIGSDGHLYSISDAPSDITYVAVAGEDVVDHSRWGVSETYSSSLVVGETYESGYIQGGAGGSISIQAPAAAIDGNLLGLTVTGERQLQNAPAASSFSLAFLGAPASSVVANVYTPAFTSDVVFQSGVSQIAPAFSPTSPTLSDASTVTLSPDLASADGFGSISVSSGNGTIAVLSPVTMQAGGSLTLSGANIDIEANITTPGGSISLTTVDIDPTLAGSVLDLFGASYLAGRGAITVGSGVVLSVAGLVVDDRVSAVAPNGGAIIVEGGAISLTGYFVDLETGSVIDASGGVHIASTGKETTGAGGSITISGGVDTAVDPKVAGSLVLDGALKGYGVGTASGGKLSLSAAFIQIGGTATQAGMLTLDSAVFNQGGFSTFTLTGYTLAVDAAINPVVASYAIGETGGAIVLTPTLLPTVSRSAVALSLTASGFRDRNSGLDIIRGDAVIGTDAAIDIEPTANGTGNVTISGETVAVLGAITAPGGAIAIKSGVINGASTGTVSVDLAAGSVLDAAGAYLPTFDSYGNVVGEVLAGGSVSVTGNIQAETGAVLDVSGASGVVEVASQDSGGHTTYVSTTVASDGGSITLSGKQNLFTDATLKGAAGGTGASGGSLSVSSGAFTSSATPNLTVTQSTLPTLTYSSGLEAIGGAAPADGGHFTVNRFTAGGFDSLTLGGLVDFSGPVSITARKSLTVASGGVLEADSAVSLAAPYVAIGVLDAAPQATQEIVAPTVTVTNGSTPIVTLVSPSYGTGTLTIAAGDLVDVGTAVLQGVKSTSLTAANDVRGDGTFEVAGALTITAGQIYPITDTVFTLAAFDYVGGVGSVTIQSSGVSRALPLSAGGEINVYATTIVQDGVLRAPIGAINLGSTTAVSALDPTLTSALQTFDASASVTLGGGSVTSVSAVDPTTGEDLTIPYGTMLNGTSWIDPSGADITSSGIPEKTINLAGATITVGTGATIDLDGGGDLYAYNWVQGTGGSKDILATSTSFAIVPSYEADYAPVVSITTQTTSGSASVESGWSSSSLHVGDQITLTASVDGLAAGVYTLLPARYALLPGAYLITAIKNSATTSGVSVVNPDGSAVVSGYRSNALNGSRSSLVTLFEVDSSTVVQERAEYDNYYADTTLASTSASSRLPQDGGQLSIAATAALTLEGSAEMTGATGGKGGVVAITTVENIVINDTGTGSANDALYISADELSDFAASSLLIGGTVSGDVITATTGSVEIANDAANPLQAPDILLVSTADLSVDAGAVVKVSGASSSSALSFVIGSSSVAGSANGALLRVSVGSSASVSRTSAAISLGGGGANLTVGAGAVISGGTAGAVVLDSTDSGSFDETATLSGAAVTIASGQISVLLNNAGTLQSSAGLVLPQTALANLQSSADALTLLSYGSIDIYGTGSIGGADSSGKPTTASLTLHAAGIRGFNQGSGAVTINAQNVVIDNSPDGAPVAAVSGVDSTPSGTLAFNAETVEFGTGTFNIVGYKTVSLTASQGVLFTGAGAFSTVGDLTMMTPLITAATSASQTVTAGGALTFNSAAGTAKVSGGLGAALTLVGASVTAATDIRLPSGTLTLHATGSASTSNATIGSGGALDVSGVSEAFYDETEYTGGGEVVLTSDYGAVQLASGAIVNVSAPAGGANAGSLSVSAVNGVFSSQATLQGQAGSGGTGGAFSVDAASLMLDGNGRQSLGALNAILDSGGFALSRAFRVRTGDVTVDGSATTQTFDLSVDSGAIAVTGTINASGTTGGTIQLYAYNGVTLADGSKLTVAAQKLDDAGKGGVVDIETGEAKSVGGVMTEGVGWIDIQTGSTIDLSVAGGAGGTLHLRAPQITGVDASGQPIPTLVNSVAGGDDLAIKPLNGQIVDAASVVVEGFQVFDLTASGGVVSSAVEANANANGQNFTASATSIASRLLSGTPNTALASALHVEPGEELVTQGTASLTLNAAGSSIQLPVGAGLNFPSGTPAGDTVSFSVAGSITSATGVVTTFAANTELTIAAGSTVALQSAGVVTFAEGSKAIAVKLTGSGNATTSAGAATTLTATGTGLGLTLDSSGSSVTLPAGVAIVIPNGLPTGDAVTASVPVTFVTTASGANVVLGGAGETLTITSASSGVSFLLPIGDSITSSSAFTSVSGGAKVTLASGKSVTLPANAAISLTLSSGAKITNNISGDVIKATSAGSTITLNNAGYSTVTLANNTTALTFPSGTGADKIRASVAATITLANGTTQALAANTATTLPAGASLTLSGGASGGVVTFASGNTAIPVTLSAGSFTLSTNISITSLASGSTLSTGSAGGTLAVTGASVSATLSAGKYTTNGVLTALPVGSTISSGTITLVSGSTPLDITLPSGTYTAGTGDLISALPMASTVAASAAGTLTFASGDTAFALSLPAGSYTTGGAASVVLASDLTLASDWNLDSYRYGPDATSVLGSGEPGVLELRASGNLIFDGSLSDGFGASPIDPNTQAAALWEAPLLAAGSRSWSYRLVAGADLSAADFHQAAPSVGTTGSVEIGKTCTCVTSSTTAATSSLLTTYYQVIRTGTGDIDIAASLDVQLLNQFATIYTAGTQITPALVDGDTTYAFDAPITTYTASSNLGANIGPSYSPQYSTGGGNVTITAGRDIIHLTAGGADDSSQELPINWLYRRDDVSGGVYVQTENGDYGSATWWVDFSNFFEGVGALGGGNVTLKAGRDVKNVDVVIPTDAWSPYQTTTVTASGVVVDTAAADQPLFEYGGGDLTVVAGRDINGGVYYVEKGEGALVAGRDVTTNATRTALGTATSASGYSSDSNTWLPTTLFLGEGSFDISADGSVLLGPVSNPFLLPMGENNGYWDRTYFTTYASTDIVSVSSLIGDVTVKDSTGSGTLAAWIDNVLALSGSNVSSARPWLRLTENEYPGYVNSSGHLVTGSTESSLSSYYSTVLGLMPPTLDVTAFTGDIDVVGSLTLTPSATGDITLLAGGSLNGLQEVSSVTNGTTKVYYSSATINLSDADPNSVPSVTSPLVATYVAQDGTVVDNSSWVAQLAPSFANLDDLFDESGSTTGNYAKASTKDALHTKGLLHADDPTPVRIYTKTGDISDVELFAGKFTRVIAGEDISDIALYIQNNNASDVSIVAAGRDITLSDPNDTARSAILAAQQNDKFLFLSVALSGDVSIGGPGTLEVLAGRNLDLGSGAENSDGTGVGIISIGNARDPYLPFGDGAQIVAAAGVGALTGADLSTSNLDFTKFIADFLDPSTTGGDATAYLPDLGSLMGLSGADDQTVWNAFSKLSAEQKATYALDIFYLVLRDAGRDHNNGDLNGGYNLGYQAIADLFATKTTTWSGNISLTSREIKTESGGDIDLLAPGGSLTVGYELGDKQPLDQGVMTLSTGNIAIFTDGDVTVGTSRIFTFKGGNEIIWSTHGNIAAGAASKTLQSAPPARFLIDTETGVSILDLSGLATGGGIGVLQTVSGAPEGDIDLIAPNGYVDAGDAGIRVSGNVNIAAVTVLNAGNISVGGTSSGVPTVQAPNIGGLTAASNASGAATKSAENAPASTQGDADKASILIVEVEGYGGGESDEEKKKRQQ